MSDTNKGEWNKGGTGCMRGIHSINYSTEEILGPCDVHHNCLECPLPACKYDDENGYILWYKQNRLKTSTPTDLYFYDRAAIEGIADREGIHPLTLYRMIREGKVFLRTHKLLMADARKIGLTTTQVATMIKLGHIERRSADQFPPIFVEREKAA